MANKIPPSFPLYQSANADADRIKDNFLIRLNEFNIIIEEIRRQPQKGSVQHFLLIGRRGSGKSTLLKRLQVELETDTELVQRYITINLAEEQANIYKLYDLLEAIIEELGYHDIDVQSITWENDIHQYARDLFAAIHNALKKSDKKLILLLDNIDRIFENLVEESSLLREYLLNFDDLKIIGGSTKMTEHFWKYNKPFYEFFRVLELKKLTSEEIKSLLLNWSQRLNTPELKDFVNNKPGQLETVRLLTDGLPRTLQFFVNILLTRSQETGYEYLRLIMDNVTPLYQERLNTLPPSQRKIILQMAFLWESTGAKEIAEATKMDTKVISAQLKQLTDKGIVDKLATSTKNHLYRLSERFFNLWLIFTQGSPKEKRKSKCLTIFMENFYDAQEIVNIAMEHLKMLETGNPVANKAALITKALAQSRYITFVMRDKLIGQTLALNNMADDLRLQLPPTSSQILLEVKEAIRKKDYPKALRIAGTVEHNDGFREFLQGFTYKMGGMNLDAEKYLQKAYDQSFEESALLLAETYDQNKKPGLAEKYYLAAKNLGSAGATFELARFYDKQRKLDKAETFYLQALQKEEWKASIKLGNFYFQEKNYQEAEKYYQLGIDHKESGSAIGLAMLFFFQNKYKEKAKQLVDTERIFTPIDTPYLDLFAILIDTWTGQFGNLESKTEKLIEKKIRPYEEMFLSFMLALHQTNLVIKLFKHLTLGEQLKEKYLPLYYASILLSEGKQETDLRIPPEIRELVNAQVTQINDLRQLFH